VTRLLVNIDVPDVARAEAFYCAAFGLKPARRFGPDGVELLGLEAPLYLLRKDAGSAPFDGAESMRRYERHWSPVHLDIVVADIEVALQRAVAAGAVQERPIKAANWGKLALLADPFGHGFCLVQFLGRGYDEICD